MSAARIAESKTGDALRFKYRLLNSEEEKVENIKIVDNEEPLPQPSLIREKVQRKIYSYSPLPSQSDPHPSKVVNFLPPSPATKDFHSAYEYNSYPTHQYNSYPTQAFYQHLYHPQYKASCYLLQLF